MKETLNAQLAAIGAFIALVALHAVAFRFLHASWRDALTDFQGLYFVYFLAAFAGVERFSRPRE